MLSAFVLAIYTSAGVFSRAFASFLLPLTIIALVSMLVESLPNKDVDNITVTVIAVVLGHFLF